MIINKQVGGVYLIDPTILDPTTRIVKVLSLDCVAISKINTAPLDSRIIFSDEEGKPTASVNFNSSLQYQDDGGTPTNWTGTIDQLLQKLNNEYFITSSGGGGSTSDTTAANQVILIDQTAAKKIGYVLDIAAAGTPPPYTDLVELIQNIDGNSVSYPIANLAADTTEDLAQIFNDLQKDIYYAALDSEKLYFVPVEDATGDITEILFEDSNEGQLSFSSPYTQTTDTPTGALHQLVTLAQQQKTLLGNQSTAAKQDAQTALITELDDNTKRKAIGSVVDLTADINGDWVGFPLAADTLSLTINGDTFDFSIPQVSANNEVLVEQFNNAQNLVSFDYVKNEDKIVFNGVSVSNVEVQLIVINVVGLAQLGYNTFPESTEQETGALQQLVLLLQAQLQLSKGAEPKATPTRLVNPSTVDFTGFKYLVFSCDGANNSITVTQGGSSVTYPQANLDGSLLRGYELPLSKVPYTNSITFNGTGTVDILKID